VKRPDARRPEGDLSRKIVDARAEGEVQETRTHVSRSLMIEWCPGSISGRSGPGMDGLTVNEALVGQEGDERGCYDRWVGLSRTKGSGAGSACTIWWER
jgi:hypothetical protein